MKTKIYKITNAVNDRVYVGKTGGLLKERFKQHKWDSKRAITQERPLCQAIKKYGIDKFSIHLIEECDEEISSEREIYWIKYYHSYSSGYNATKGGDGRILYDYDKIAELIKNNYTYSEIEDLVGCSVDTIRKVSKVYNLEIKTTKNDMYKRLMASRIAVDQLDQQGNYIQTFKSYADAARWLEDNGYVKGNLNGVRGKIGLVCRGERKTAYKFKWCFSTKV